MFGLVGDACVTFDISRRDGGGVDAGWGRLRRPGHRIPPMFANVALVEDVPPMLWNVTEYT